MAKIFGKGYYNDWDTMVVGIKVGLQRAFEEACNEVCEKADEIIRGAIYSNNMGETYDDFRTYEMGAIGYLKANVSGTYCYFTFGNEEILTLTQDNPEHHALTDDPHNGYDTDSFMVDIIDDHDNKQFLEEVKYFIQKEFPNIYRERCRANGLEL